MCRFCQSGQIRRRCRNSRQAPHKWPRQFASNRQQIAWLVLRRTKKCFMEAEVQHAGRRTEFRLDISPSVAGQAARTARRCIPLLQLLSVFRQERVFFDGGGLSQFTPQDAVVVKSYVIARNKSASIFRTKYFALDMKIELLYAHGPPGRRS